MQTKPMDVEVIHTGDSDDEIAELRIQALLTKKVNEAEVSSEPPVSRHSSPWHSRGQVPPMGRYAGRGRRGGFNREPRFPFQGNQNYRHRGSGHSYGGTIYRPYINNTSVNISNIVVLSGGDNVETDAEQSVPYGAPNGGDRGRVMAAHGRGGMGYNNQGSYGSGIGDSVNQVVGSLALPQYKNLPKPEIEKSPEKVSARWERLKDNSYSESDSEGSSSSSSGSVSGSSSGTGTGSTSSGSESESDSEKSVKPTSVLTSKTDEAEPIGIGGIKHITSLASLSVPGHTRSEGTVAPATQRRSSNVSPIPRGKSPARLSPRVDQPQYISPARARSPISQLSPRCFSPLRRSPGEIIRRRYSRSSLSRSLTPIRGRSPFRPRTPSPFRRFSPIRRSKSPIRLRPKSSRSFSRSPIRLGPRGSRSPGKLRPVSPRRWSRSPVRYKRSVSPRGRPISPSRLVHPIRSRSRSPYKRSPLPGRTGSPNGLKMSPGRRQSPSRYGSPRRFSSRPRSPLPPLRPLSPRRGLYRSRSRSLVRFSSRSPLRTRPRSPLNPRRSPARPIKRSVSPTRRPGPLISDSHDNVRILRRSRSPSPWQKDVVGPRGTCPQRAIDRLPGSFGEPPMGYGYRGDCRSYSPSRLHPYGNTMGQRRPPDLIVGEAQKIWPPLARYSLRRSPSPCTSQEVHYPPKPTTDIPISRVRVLARLDRTSRFPGQHYDDGVDRITCENTSDPGHILPAGGERKRIIPPGRTCITQRLGVQNARGEAVLRREDRFIDKPLHVREDTYLDQPKSRTDRFSEQRHPRDRDNNFVDQPRGRDDRFSDKKKVREGRFSDQIKDKEDKESMNHKGREERVLDLHCKDIEDRSPVTLQRFGNGDRKRNIQQDNSREKNQLERTKKGGHREEGKSKSKESRIYSPRQTSKTTSRVEKFVPLSPVKSRPPSEKLQQNSHEKCSRTKNKKHFESKNNDHSESKAKKKEHVLSKIKDLGESKIREHAESKNRESVQSKNEYSVKSKNEEYDKSRNADSGMTESTENSGKTKRSEFNSKSTCTVSESPELPINDSSRFELSEHNPSQKKNIPATEPGKGKNSSKSVERTMEIKTEQQKGELKSMELRTEQQKGELKSMDLRTEQQKGELKSMDLRTEQQKGELKSLKPEKLLGVEEARDKKNAGEQLIVKEKRKEIDSSEEGEYSSDEKEKKKKKKKEKKKKKKKDSRDSMDKKKKKKSKKKKHRRSSSEESDTPKKENQKAPERPDSADLRVLLKRKTIVNNEPTVAGKRRKDDDFSKVKTPYEETRAIRVTVDSGIDRVRGTHSATHRLEDRRVSSSGRAYSHNDPLQRADLDDAIADPFGSSVVHDVGKRLQVKGHNIVKPRKSIKDRLSNPRQVGQVTSRLSTTGGGGMKGKGRKGRQQENQRRKNRDVRRHR